jgi:hypothetical protein
MHFVTPANGRCTLCEPATRPQVSRPFGATHGYGRNSFSGKY